MRYPRAGWEARNFLIEKMRVVARQKIVETKKHMDSYLGTLIAGLLWMLSSGCWWRRLQIPTVG